MLKIFIFNISQKCWVMQVLYIIFICIAGVAPATQRFKREIIRLVTALAINIYRKCCIQVLKAKSQVFVNMQENAVFNTSDVALALNIYRGS